MSASRPRGPRRRAARSPSGAALARAERPAPLRLVPPPRRRRRRRGWLLLAALAAGTLLWLSRGAWWPSLPPPQLILVLGGNADRERVAADLARRDGLPVLVSGGSNPEYAHWLFEQQGLDQGRVQLDYRATDTLSNFTSVVDDLRRAKVRHVLLVTSSYHMDRALLVGRLVAGSRGIALTPVEVPCGKRCFREGRRKVWGDGLRAALWVLSGRDVRAWAAERLAPLLEGVRGR